MMKKIIFYTLLTILAGCSTANTGSIDNATVLHWENEAVTTEQFVKDHKQCLGVNRAEHAPRSRISKMIAPNQSSQMPNWEGLWVTFQSNEHTDIGQRALMSTPSNATSKSVGSYRKCMFKRGYLLRSS